MNPPNSHRILVASFGGGHKPARDHQDAHQRARPGTAQISSPGVCRVSRRGRHPSHSPTLLTLSMPLAGSHGVQFINTPNTYYDQFEARLKTASVKVKEDLNVLREQEILIDYDDQGYLLQLFTKPLEDRPTLFIEIIQRRNHKGFGVCNFKSLFESIEAEQQARGNL